MGAVLYTDVNCPFCFATETRLEALGLAGQVEWRGVEHEPDLPVPMDVHDADIAAELEEEVGSVRRRAPDVPIAVPGGKPNTARALVTAAAAGRDDPVRGRAVRLSLFQAFWTDGRDVSDPDVIAAVLAAHGMDDLAVGTADEVQVATWRLEWERAPVHGVPLFVRADGETLYGLKDSEVLDRFLRPG